MALPADLDAGEIADKATSTSARSSPRRAQLVDLLFSAPADPAVIHARADLP
jgi:hypothetical protein